MRSAVAICRRETNRVLLPFPRQIIGRWGICRRFIKETGKFTEEDVPNANGLVRGKDDGYVILNLALSTSHRLCCLGLSDVILVNSKFTARVFQTHFSIPRIPRVIYPGINFSAYDAVIKSGDEDVAILDSYVALVPLQVYNLLRHDSI